MNKPVIHKNFIDRALEVVAPTAALKRYSSRMKILQATNAGYVTPGSRKKSMKGVTATANSANQDTLTKVKGSRALSRDVYMDTPLGSGILRTARRNVIGSGLMLQSRIDRKFLGLSAEEAQTWQTNIEREFDTWASSLNASFDGNMNFYEIQGLWLLSSFMNGDTFFMLPWKQPKGPKNWPYELRVKSIEADLVVDPNGPYCEHIISETNKRDTLGGIEVSKTTGEMQAIHVAKRFPNGYSYFSDDEIKRIPVFDRNKDRQIWQIVDKERIGQRRGMPWMAPILEGVKQISRLTEAELMHAIVSSFFSVVIKDNSNLGAKLQQPFTPEQSIDGGGGYGPDAIQEPKDEGSEFDVEMGHANVIYMDEDQEAQVLDPVKTDKSFKDFEEAISTQLSASCGAPIEQVRMLFKSSYTAARAALLEGWKMWKTSRTWITRRAIQPTYEEFITELVLKGRVNAPGFFDDALIKAAWTRSAWIGQGMGQLNPLVETKASIEKINNFINR